MHVKGLLSPFVLSPQPPLWHEDSEDKMRGTNHICSNGTTKPLQRCIYFYLRRKQSRLVRSIFFLFSFQPRLQPSMTQTLFFSLRSFSISPLALIEGDDVARNRYPAEEWRGGAVRGADLNRHLCSCSLDPSYFEPHPRLQQGQGRLKGSAVGLEYTCEA